MKPRLHFLDTRRLSDADFEAITLAIAIGGLLGIAAYLWFGP